MPIIPVMPGLSFEERRMRGDFMETSKLLTGLDQVDAELTIPLSRVFRTKGQFSNNGLAIHDRDELFALGVVNL